MRSTGSSSRAAATSTPRTYGAERTPGDRQAEALARRRRARDARGGARRATCPCSPSAAARSSSTSPAAATSCSTCRTSVGARAAQGAARVLLRARRVDRAAEPARQRCSASTRPVKSHHHQGIGPHRRRVCAPVAWAEDGIVEGLEDPGEALRARRALAPGGRRGLRALPGARGRGARYREAAA